MILVDPRIGSGDVADYLRYWHVPHELTRLPFGDAAFAGNGPSGPSTVAIGIEIKAVHDALACMSNGRFSGHQLPGLVALYDRVWLVVEGWYKPDLRNGVLLTSSKRRREIALGSRRFMYRELDNWLTTMEVMASVRVRRTGDRMETARFVADLYSWWTNKKWGEHHSHLIPHSEAPDRLLLSNRGPRLSQLVAAQLPGVKWIRSHAIVAHFRGKTEGETVENMIDASEKQWCEIDGIGKTIARRVWTALHK